MARVRLPSRPSELTPEWLTQALRAGGALGDARVVEAEGRSIGGDLGFVGEITRLALRYDGDAPGAPRRLIAKIPTAVGVNRGLGASLGAYEREVRFYQRLAARSGARTPRCYYAECDPTPAAEQSQRIAAWFDRLPRWLLGLLVRLFLWLARFDRRRSVLLLEDLGDARLGDQVAGCAPGEAARALRAVAPMHAAFWESAELGLHWWIAPLDLLPRTFQLVYERALGAFRARFGAALPDLERHADWLLANGESLMRRLARAPATLVHLDFRLDNLCFRDPDDGVVLFDWQSVARGPAATDVAYFLAGSLAQDTPRDVELELLRGYHGELCRAGVADYPLDSLLADYDRSLLFVLHRLVCGSDAVELGEGRGRVLFDTMLRRAGARLRHVECGRVLD
jgi:aminoglycoside/choline kinase family phosphotransferase